MTSPRLRLYRVIWVLLVITVRNWRGRIVARILSEEASKEAWKKMNERNAALLYRTILRLEGLFIKVGQFMSLRVDILPRAYTQTLARLQDQVPPKEYGIIEERLARELGRAPSGLFREFRREPLAAASLGQVHEAVLMDGRRVAVKIQYPGIEKVVETDLRILRLVLRWLRFLRPGLDVEIILEEFTKAVTGELDYIAEGKNAERVAGNFAGDPGVVIPGVVWDLTTRRVLVLEFIPGIKVTDLDRLVAAGIDVKEVSRRVMDCWFRQIFRYGFFQADAHPGNLFVCPNGKGFKIAVVDFGLSKELPPGMLRNFGRLALGLIRSEPGEMAAAMEALGFVTVGGGAEGLKSFTDFVVRHAGEVLYRNRKKIDFQAIYEEIMDIVRKNPIVRIPGDFILIGRVLGQLTGVGRQLGAKIDVSEIVLPYLYTNSERG